MRKFIFFYLSLLWLTFPFFAEAKKISVKDLPENYRKWLEEEVVYIIRPKEKEVFLHLEADKERDIFIEAFWKQRDPTPGTPENEFKREHYRRIAYANKFFGRETTREGWKTDRGRIYIILGDPVDIDRYDYFDEIYPVEVWFYEGDTKYGLPPFFNVAFFKRRGIGEYVLYSPAQDGPQKLLKKYYGDPADFEMAYEKLKEYDAVLASVSISLIPSERPFVGHPSLASEVMMANVIELPRKKVEDTYAEKLLRYKDIVEVEYSTNYIGSDYLVTLIMDPSNAFFVHFSIDPKTLSIGFHEDKYYAYFELVTQVTDLQGKTIFQYQKDYPLHFNKDQLQDIKLKSYSIQDMFPLAPGKYRLSVLLKNTVSKEFTSFETDISIPEIPSLQMTFPLFCYKTEEELSSEKHIKPFKINGLQLFCQPKKMFVSKEDLTIFFQLYGLSKQLEDEISVKYIFYKDSEEFQTKTININENRDKTNFIQKFSLENFTPGYYTLKVALIDREQREIISEKDNFTISFSEITTRPWIIAKALPTFHKDEYTFILGNQLLNKGDTEGAKSYLESVYNNNPLSLKYAHGFCRALFALREYKKVKDVLKPFVEDSPENYEFLSLLGKSCQALRGYEEAIQYYKKYLSHMGTNLFILNSIGECYYLTGKNEEALVAWEKSLELDPNQEVIKEKVISIKEKKK